MEILLLCGGKKQNVDIARPRILVLEEGCPSRLLKYVGIGGAATTVHLCKRV
jgi:hypothetical protein